jgi:exonuclease VII large subunit
VNITDLTERFKQEEAATNERAKQIQNDALERLTNACNQQCNAAESTLKNALESSLKLLQSAISENTFAMNQQLAAVNKDVKAWTPRLTKSIKLGVLYPILATGLVCAAAIGGTLALLKSQNREYVHMRPLSTD